MTKLPGHPPSVIRYRSELIADAPRNDWNPNQNIAGNDLMIEGRCVPTVPYTALRYTAMGMPYLIPISPVSNITMITIKLPSAAAHRMEATLKLGYSVDPIVNVVNRTDIPTHMIPMSIAIRCRSSSLRYQSACWHLVDSLNLSIGVVTFKCSR